MKSNLEWKKWGATDPLYAVATWAGKSKTGSAPWQEEEFYRLGESDWTDFLSQWEQYGFRAGSCLEIGCGAGRITKPLATSFTSVIACDVSAEMLHYARSNISQSTVEFLLVEELPLTLMDHTIDAVFSTHVFQHFESLADASQYFAEVYRVMRCSGSFMIHLPIYSWPHHQRLFSILCEIFKYVEDFRAQYRRLMLRRGIWQPFMRTLAFEVDWLYKELDRLGFENIEIRIMRVKSNNSIHPFVFARKGA